MHEDSLQGQWALVRQRLQQRWGKLTDEDLAPSPDPRGRLLQRIQQRYGVLGAEAERQLHNWERKASERWIAAALLTTQRHVQ